MSKINLHSISNNFREREREGGEEGGRERGREGEVSTFFYFYHITINIFSIM